MSPSEANHERFQQILVNNPDVQGLVCLTTTGRIKLEANYSFRSSNEFKFLNKRIAQLNSLIDQQGSEFYDKEVIDTTAVPEIDKADVLYFYHGVKLGFSKEEAKKLVNEIIKQL